MALLGGLAIKANEKPKSELSLLPTHNYVSKPPPFIPGNEVLLVGLAQHLGRGITQENSNDALKLKSAGKPLLLKDSNGLIHKSNEINIAWRKIYLTKPRTYERKVIGPFASFESAQKVASSITRENFSVQIAHPDDWEVWLPKDVPIQNDIQSTTKVQQVSFLIKPVLQTRNGEYLLNGPVSINSSDGLIWKGGVYLGPFSLKPDAYGTWTFVEHVPLERYLLGVVPHEIGSRVPSAALAAQSVLARTWALANSQRFFIDGYHLCSNTQCQVYKNPDKASNRIKKAISKTSRKILLFQKKPINAFYHATNGGVMGSAQEAWAMNALPYLVAKLDGSSTWTKAFKLPLTNKKMLRNFLSSRAGSYGKDHSLFRWNRTFTARDLKEALAKAIPDKQILLPQSVKVLQRGISGRVIKLEISGTNNDSLFILSLDNIRRILPGLPSTLFIVDEIEKGVWKFIGGGFGHGAGMSQAGAIELAEMGWTEKQILMHYYPGARYGSLTY